MADAVATYLKHIRVERGFSRKTVQTYQAWLRHFTRWLGGVVGVEPDITHITTERLRDFAAYLVDQRKHQPKSVHSAFHAIRSLTIYLSGQGLIPKDPCAGLKMPKRRSPQRPSASDEEVARLLKACDDLPDGRIGSLVKAIISVVAFAGLRRAELRDLKIGDVSFEQNAITIRNGKGGKARKVYPHPDCLAAIQAWLKVRGECDHDWLFAHNRRWRIGYDRIGELINIAKVQAGLGAAKHITPHAFRHGWATRLILGGASLLTIRDALGHASIETTQAYLHSDERSQRELAQFGALRTAPSHASLAVPIGPSQAGEARCGS